MERLASNNTRRESVVIRIFIHNPSHDPRVRIYVRRRDVNGGADNFLDLAHEGSRDRVQFSFAQFFGVAIDSSLGTTERDIDHGRFPRHQVRQCSGVFLVDGGVVSQAAFHGTARFVVLHAKALMVEQLPVVALGDDLHFHDA